MAQPPKYTDGAFKKRIKEVFIQDAIVDAALKQAAYRLKDECQVGTFARLYYPTSIKILGDGREYCRYIGWENGKIDKIPPAEPRPVSDSVMKILKEFWQNISLTSGEGNKADSVSEPDETELELIAIEHASAILEQLSHLQTHSSAVSKPDTSNGNLTLKTDTIALINTWGEDKTASGLRQQAEATFFRALQASISGAKSNAAFAYGGSLSISADYYANKCDSTKLSPPVILDWDTADEQIRRITFNGKNADSTELSKSIEDLCNSCQPASFGRNGENVLDAEYRNAVKLEPSTFLTNFSPYLHGVVDNIAQILLPSFRGAQSDENIMGIEAELYKLNVYSGPSGKFKAHVDTPRSDYQFGSLVVCLPIAHQGGSLLVRHNGKEMQYSWGDSRCIEWAAFYSDVEHEVDTVLSGHRVTLTYNLYFRYSSYIPPGFSTSPAVDTLPLYQDMHAALSNPGLLRSGGLLGFHCAHSYAHNRGEKEVGLPQRLKGVDGAIFWSFKSLGLKTTVRPIFDNDEFRERFYVDEEGEEEEGDETGNGSENKTEAPRSRLQEYQQHGRTEKDGDQLLLEYEYENDAYCGEATFKARLEYIKANRRILGLELPSRQVNRVGRSFQPIKFLDQIDEASWFEEELAGDWDVINGIKWITPAPNHREIATAYVAYGNEASSSYFYSSAAILVVVPPWTPERGDPPTQATEEEVDEDMECKEEASNKDQRNESEDRH